jgi:hypothetical protein
MTNVLIDGNRNALGTFRAFQIEDLKLSDATKECLINDFKKQVPYVNIHRLETDIIFSVLEKKED